MKLMGKAGGGAKVSSTDGSGFKGAGSDRQVSHLEKELKRYKSECEKLRNKEVSFGQEKQELDGKYKELEKKYDSELKKVLDYVKEKDTLQN